MLEKTDVAKALEKLRKPLSQKEAAAKAEIAQSTWNRYERAAQMPRPEQLEKIAARLGWSRRRLAEELMLACVERVAAEEGQIPSADGVLSEARPVYAAEGPDPALRRQRWLTLVESLLALAREEVREIFQEAVGGSRDGGTATASRPPAESGS